MKQILIPFACLIGSITMAQQVVVPRIEQMPNMPQPYAMRNWKNVAIEYDRLVFDTARAGSYLPLTRISTERGTNFADISPMYMDTYVGQKAHGNVAEAINILPAVVGASLVGINKAAQNDINWVNRLKDFFNAKNGQNVYLNNYSANTGSDWWYEVMPNVYFFQLASLYLDADADFITQIRTVAKRELDVLMKLGGSFAPWTVPNMDYRAFNLLSGRPKATGVPEPETAGSIAWLLYQAYRQTGDSTYLQGSYLAMDFLQNWSKNPSYEIQLPYGILTAAQLNAEHDHAYDIDKMMRWTFCAGQGTLRQWGCIVGNWNGYDVHGLIGEANDGGNDYAFVMNGFQHAAALAPVAKYDKRYARAIGKWLLHVANASRLFYRNGLPQSNQQSESYTWSEQHDSAACIPYEAIKQTWNGVSPKAMGDAFRSGWAYTDLSLYSGSSVGYLASLIDTTNVSGILQIDVNRTDFRGENIFPNYLYYNPTGAVQMVNLPLPAGTFNVYDAISETTLQTGVSAQTTFSIDSDSARLLVLIPANETLVPTGHKLCDSNGHVVDYHYHYAYALPQSVHTEQAANCSVYPNPFSTSFTIENVPNMETLQLYDITGRTVWKQTGANELIRPQGLAAGSYFVRATDKLGHTFQATILKQ